MAVKSLASAGIELNYTGQSTMGASTSAVAGLSADIILEAADWASVQTFRRFYHRESSAGDFERAVVNGYILSNCGITLCYTVYRRHCIVTGQ